jgi:hypothetical protein
VGHEFQSDVSRFGDLAPRLAFSYAPGKDHLTVVRIGAGVFYDRRPPPLLEQALRYNGALTQQYVFTNPSYPCYKPAGGGGSRVECGVTYGFSVDLPARVSG